LDIIIGSSSAPSLVVHSLVIIFIPVLGRLVLAASHANITADTDAAALLRDHTAQSGALGEAWELLGREDDEGRRFDLQAVGDMGIDTRLGVSTQ
jgi:hypothetical protein